MFALDADEIDTPWETQKIAWRHDCQEARHATLRKRAADPYATHIVREVLVHNPRTNTVARTISETEDVLAYTNNEFDILRTCGFMVERPEWHVFMDPKQQIRTLARVAIIEGVIPARDIVDEMHSCYQASSKPGHRLNDVYDHRQYLEGHPRMNPCSQGIHLVDIEPYYLRVDR